MGLFAALGAAALYIRTLRVRGRELERAVRELRNRDETRTAYCLAFGHQLDETCRCTRCLTEQHAYEEIDSHRTCLRSELVNPDADPGALYLSADFQPDHDYGKTQTVYRVEQTDRCARCGHERRTVDEEKVPDDV
jgi:hypothetical protein